MQIHKGVDSFIKLPKAVITTGTFDGVHLGHETILNKLIAIGKNTNTETVLITFFPHPRNVLFPEGDLKLINTPEENLNLFNSYNIDHLIFQKFDKNFSRLTSLEYIRDILIQKIGLKDLVIGYNHHFGRNREGSIDELKEYADVYDFNIHEVESYELTDKSVSSSKIREALQKGDMLLANGYLGYNFRFSGTVIRGEGMGSSFGFPTANIKLKNKNKIIPKEGVYAVIVYYNEQQYQGMINIGYNPTLNKNKLSIEVHIFNFHKSIYGEEIKVEFIKRIRSEKKFQTTEELKNQLAADKITSLNLLR